MTSEDDELNLIDDSEQETGLEKGTGWKVLVVDDDPSIHEVTLLALSDLNYEGKGLDFLHAYSEQEAKEQITAHPDTALILLDVVMQRDDAGLSVVQYIREQLKNLLVRIILRTGQPGKAPILDVIQQYDINDYKEKTELTAEKLFTAIIASLRSYQHLLTIEERNQALVEAQKMAQSADRMKREFLANLGHELRTPMVGLFGMLDLVRTGKLEEKQKQRLDIAYRSTQGLWQVVSDILDFAALAGGKLDLKPEPFDLQRFTEKLIDLMSASTYNKQLSLEYHIAEGVPAQIDGDALRLRQILSNLLSNAVKFTATGGIDITLCRDDAATFALPPGHYPLRFEVKDSGIGIAPEDQQRIFNSFTQADGSATREHGGTGLGLSICKALVERMGGQLGVESSLGQGSTFWFVVPVQSG